MRRTLLVVLTGATVLLTGCTGTADTSAGTRSGVAPSEVSSTDDTGTEVVQTVDDTEAARDAAARSAGEAAAAEEAAAVSAARSAAADEAEDAGCTGSACDTDAGADPAETTEVEQPSFSCDAGPDGLPICEGDVPRSVGPYSTPDGTIMGR